VKALIDVTVLQSREGSLETTSRLGDSAKLKYYEKRPHSKKLAYQSTPC